MKIDGTGILELYSVPNNDSPGFFYTKLKITAVNTKTGEELISVPYTTTGAPRLKINGKTWGGLQVYAVPEAGAYEFTVKYSTGDAAEGEFFIGKLGLEIALIALIALIGGLGLGFVALVSFIIIASIRSSRKKQIKQAEFYASQQQVPYGYAPAYGAPAAAPYAPYVPGTPAPYAPFNPTASAGNPPSPPRRPPAE
ncbi:MAG: hypothetical protein LBJ12_00490 [Oscillospiraceae bacterium]|nr:hypothetical protein [Oscillospiraceae bacterium]